MKVLLINLEFDCAGVSWHLRNALNSIPGWEACSIVKRHTPAAPYADYCYCEIDDITKAAEGFDILHFNNWIWTHKPNTNAFLFHPYNEYGEGHPFEKLVGKKKFVFHFHGGFHQLNPAYWVRECKLADASILKCDPIAPIPYATWLPNVLDLSTIRPHTVPYNDGVRVAIHNDTADGRRNNKVIVQSLDYLSHTQPITHQCFSNMLRYEALELRRSYNLSIDNLTQGFTGMWGWESLALGHVLLSRYDPRTLTAYKKMFGEDVPVRDVTNIDEMAEIAMFYVKHPNALQQDGENAIRWSHTHYTPSTIVRKYIDFYKNL